ncbi:MAG: S1 RNA-binding domain-containing protein, partial [Rickettsiales bacterium]|nr:S1 RNA-binding domain-containing protein [Rickettsiales bacterium]
KEFKKGDVVKAKILAMELDKERVALGIKQLEKDPMEDVTLTKGKVATFTVTAVNDDGIEVEVVDGITTFIKRSDLSADRLDQRPEKFAVGDRVDAKVINADRAARKFTLSIKAYELDEQKRAIAEYGSTDSGASLGDILGIALDSAKEKKAASEKKAPAKAASKKSAKDSDEEAKAEKKAPAKKASKAKADDDAEAKEDKKPAAKKAPAKKTAAKKTTKSKDKADE